MMQLRNFTQESVEHYLDRWYKEAEVCQCENCRLDIMAIMLNNLPPKYVVTDQGALWAQMVDFDPQNRTDYMTAMTQAIQIVASKPRHDT